MARVGFHAAHELYPPGALLQLVRRAEQAGFAAASCSDHFHPWTPAQGQSGFSFAWLGAALQATALPFGVVCAPGQRYHPAVVAQASATLAEMFPGRFWLAVGTGEALNESITGDPWPSKPERQARLREAVDVMRSLWAGETVTHRGRVRINRARLYTRPPRPPLLVGAALTEETAHWVGSWADALLCGAAEPDALRSVVEAFRAGGGEGKPMFLQAAVGYDPDEARAWQAAHERWPVAVLGPDVLEDEPAPEGMARAAAGSRPEDLRGKLRISSDLGRHVAWIQGDLALGFEAVYLHNVAGEPERFIDVFGEKVLPAVSSPSGPACAGS